MKKVLLSLMAVTVSALVFSQNGTMTTNPSPITTDDVASTITVNYDPTGSSLNVNTNLDLYMWVGSKNSNWSNKTLVMTKVSNTNFTYTFSIQSVLSLTEADILSATSIGIIVRDAENKQTGNFEFDILPSEPGTDRFSFDWGPKEGSGDGWEKIELTDSGDGDKFTGAITVPEDYNMYRGWAGYNNGGTGDPGWIANKSEDINFENMPGIAAGKMIVVITKSSTEKNWGINMIPDTGTGITEKNGTSVVCRGIGNSIVAGFEGQANISVYSVSGALVKQLTAYDQAVIDIQKGLYIVKVNTDVFKVIVK